MSRYNSIVFSSLTVPSEYTVLQADERIEQSIDLFTSNIDNVQHAYEPSGSTAKIRALLEDSGKPGALERLTPSECIDQYAVSFLTSRNDVILVSQVTGDRNITLDWDYVTTTNVGERMESFSWICSGLEIHEPCRPKLDDIRKKADNWRPNGHRVKYCLSKPITKQLCRVNFNIPLAIGVILSNLVKMVVLVYIAIYLAPDRLLVLGDAIQSFVARPDTYSKQSCLASLRQIRHSPSRGSWIGMRVLTRVRKRWLSPVSAMRITVGAIQ